MCHPLSKRGKIAKIQNGDNKLILNAIKPERPLLAEDCLPVGFCEGLLLRNQTQKIGESAEISVPRLHDGRYQAVIHRGISVIS